MPVQQVGSSAEELAPLYSLQKDDAITPAAGRPVVASSPISTRIVTPNPTADSSAAVLAGIASADLAKIAAIIEPARSPEATARIENLLRDATSAVAQGNTARALGNLTEITTLDPQTLEVLRTDPVWAPVRVEIDHLLNRFTAVAKIDGETALSRAAQFVDAAATKTIPNWQSRPEALLNAAQRLFDTGGYANYVRSADLAQAIVDYSPYLLNYTMNPALPVTLRSRATDDDRPAARSQIFLAWIAARTRASMALRTLWMRAPLLILLLAWLALGLVVGPISILLKGFSSADSSASLISAFYEAWGIGFLALVGFGFYAQIRRVRL
jgi:hypothetical protein